MAALPEIHPDELTGKARELYDELIAKRGRIDGMYLTLLHHPDLLKRVSDLGTFFRFGESVLPADVRELVILHLAAKFRAGYEWVKHVGPAAEAGVPGPVIEAIRLGRHPAGLGPVRAAALTVADHALVLQSIPVSVQETMEKALGREAVLEVVALCGFYRLIAGVIFCFNVPLPPGETDPFSQEAVEKTQSAASV